MNRHLDSNTDPAERTITTGSAGQTFTLGQTLATRLDHGVVMLLYGDLGSGKTAFTQGLARGLGVPADVAVTSPTYTLINEYPARLPLVHVDLYRLPAPVDPEEIGLLEMFDEGGVVAIEWAERLHEDDRPARRLDLFFTRTGDKCRSIHIIAYGLEHADLLKEIVVPTPPDL